MGEEDWEVKDIGSDIRCTVWIKRSSFEAKLAALWPRPAVRQQEAARAARETRSWKEVYD